MVKAYNCTAGNMECGAEALIKLLQDWAPSDKAGEQTKYRYKTTNYTTSNTCNRSNERKQTETRAQLHRQGYSRITDAVNQLKDPFQITAYTCSECQKRNRNPEKHTTGRKNI